MSRPEKRQALPESELQESFIRASGPGGQNVNKVASAVQLRFDVEASPSLSSWQKQQLRRIAGHLMTRDGVLILLADRFRSQAQNRADARERLAGLLAEASAPPPKKRRPTKPTAASVERRLRRKALRGRAKRLRMAAPEEQ